MPFFWGYELLDPAEFSGTFMVLIVLFGPAFFEPNHRGGGGVGEGEGGLRPRDYQCVVNSRLGVISLTFPPSHITTHSDG
jgi:hypothetical protein